MTSQEIADKARLPVATVNYFFSVSSKSPSINTVVPICQVLGVSLDRVFELKEEENTPEGERALLERLISSAKKGLRIRNIIILGLMSCLVLVLTYAIIMDSNIAGVGFFK